MTKYTVGLLTVACLALLAASAGAETIYLKGGATIEGEVIRVEDDMLVIELEETGAEITLALAQLSPYGQFLIREQRINPTSVEDRLALANWALDKGLHSLAYGQFRAAENVSKDELPEEEKRKMVEVRDRCGQDRLSYAEDLVELGRLEEARDVFRSLTEEMSACPAAATAKERLPVIEERIGRQTVAEDGGAEEVEQDRKRIEQEIARARELMDIGDRLRAVSYADARGRRNQQKDLEAAVGAYRRARQLLQSAEGRVDAEQVIESLQSVDAELKDRLVKAWVDLGHYWVARGSLVVASRYVGRALSLDPNDPEAIRLRSQIAEARSDGGFPVRRGGLRR